jgi:NTP pyrophosphatase (non-canonical NTP hydrolase)
MNWNQYLELSEKTLSTQFHCEEKEQLLLHAVIGVLTEVEEILDNYISPEKRNVTLDPVNILEEVGDVTWYLAIIGRMYNIEMPAHVPGQQKSEPLGLIITITKNTLKLLDVLKKKMYYNKPIDDESFAQNARIIMVLIMEYMSCYNIDIEGSFDINISKLKARYGDKFSSERAINRDLETERNILEGN